MVISPANSDYFAVFGAWFGMVWGVGGFGIFLELSKIEVLLGTMINHSS